MEPKRSKEITVRDFSLVEWALSFWSRAEIQVFIETGLPRDIADMVGSEDFDIDKAYGALRSMERPGSSHEEDVSLPQALDLMNIAPKESFEKWEAYFNMITYLGMNSKFFYRETHPLWQCRDKVRVVLGLPPINLIYKNEQGQEVLFRRTGHCKIWSNPEEGFRYAAYLAEIPIDALNALEGEWNIVSFYCGSWGTIIASKSVGDYLWSKLQVNVTKFFHNNIFYIPLVKI